MIALNAPEIDGDQTLKFEIWFFAAEMPEQNIFGRDRRVGLELETPMAVRVLLGEQRFRRAGDMTLERIRRWRVLRMIEGDIHCEKLMGRRLGASTPEATTIV